MNYSDLYNEYNFLSLEKKYNLFFDDKDLLVRAFTHTSYTGDVNGNYERLEFLGDAVLQIIVSDYMYRHDHDEREGVMSKQRAKLVNEVSLNYVMEQEDLVKYIVIGQSMKGIKTPKSAYIADIYEAFVASIYLDQGYEKANEFVHNTIIKRRNDIIKIDENNDYKTELQEILQQNGSIQIKYTSDKVSDQLFAARVEVDGVVLGIGQGNSKKAAEQQAAKEAISKHV